MPVVWTTVVIRRLWHNQLPQTAKTKAASRPPVAVKRFDSLCRLQDCLGLGRIRAGGGKLQVFVQGLCCSGLVLLGECCALEEPGFSFVGIGRGGFFAGRRCVVIFARVKGQSAQIVIGDRRVGISGGRLLVGGNGLVRLALLHVDAADQVQHLARTGLGLRWISIRVSRVLGRRAVSHRLGYLDSLFKRLRRIIQLVLVLLRF